MEGGTEPDGWRAYAIDDIADVVGGSTPSTREPANFDGDVPWLTPKDLSGPHDWYMARGERNLSQQGLDSCSAKLLPVGSVLLSTRAPIGYVALAKNPIATNQGFRSLIPREGVVAEYLYAALPVVEPAAAVVDAFGTYALSCDERIRGITAQARALATQRDALLPKLVSGQVRVGDN